MLVVCVWRFESWGCHTLLMLMMITFLNYFLCLFCLIAGEGLGTLIGGVIYHIYGGRFLFRASAVLCGITMALCLLINWCLKVARTRRLNRILQGSVQYGTIWLVLPICFFRLRGQFCKFVYKLYGPCTKYIKFGLEMAEWTRKHLFILISEVLLSQFVNTLNQNLYSLC